MRYGNPQPEAPTHLGRHQLPLPPEWLPAEEFEDSEPPTHAAARGAVDAWPSEFDISDSVPTRQPTERSASPILLERRRQPAAVPHPDDVRREARRSKAKVAVAPAAVAPTVEARRPAAT